MEFSPRRALIYEPHSYILCLIVELGTHDSSKYPTCLTIFFSCGQVPNLPHYLHLPSVATENHQVLVCVFFMDPCQVLIVGHPRKHTGA